MRPLLNCWVVSLWLWWQSRGRALIWMRRSLHFRGWIPHSGTVHHGGWRRISMVEYIPYHSKVWSKDNIVVLFSGRYRVWEMRVHRCRSFKSMEEVRAYLRGER